MDEIEHADDGALISLRANAADLDKAQKTRKPDGAEPEEDASEHPSTAKSVAKLFEGEETDLVRRRLMVDG